MLAMMGASLVGMSTVLEVIADRHMGLRCLVLSLVANLGAGVVDDPLDHEEVVAAGAAASEKLIALLKAVLEDDRLYGE
jgi:purine-nucleoside phosphorylase